MCIPTRTYLTCNNDKPWVTAKLRQLRQAKEQCRSLTPEGPTQNYRSCNRFLFQINAVLLHFLFSFINKIILKMCLSFYEILGGSTTVFNNDNNKNTQINIQIKHKASKSSVKNYTVMQYIICLILQY